MTTESTIKGQTQFIVSLVSYRNRPPVTLDNFSFECIYEVMHEERMNFEGTLSKTHKAKETVID